MSLYRNTASSHEIKQHLLACEFNPPLEDYVDLDVYVDKIIKNAERFEIWEEGQLVGFLACYANNVATKESFITMVSVLPEARGRGLALNLIIQAIEHCKKAGYKRMLLDVRTENKRALSVYEKQGFRPVSRNGDTLRMSQDI